MLPRKELVCLLIDDDKDDQDIFRISLSGLSSPVRMDAADNAVAALESLKRESAIIPDFIFIDINLPRMNGVQFLREIKNIPALKQIPVYMYSTSSQASIMKECMHLGAAGFVVKSSDLGELEETLKSVVGQVS